MTTLFRCCTFTQASAANVRSSSFPAEPFWKLRSRYDLEAGTLDSDPILYKPPLGVVRNRLTSAALDGRIITGYGIETSYPQTSGIYSIVCPWCLSEERMKNSESGMYLHLVRLEDDSQAHLEPLISRLLLLDGNWPELAVSFPF
ncbi:hypothetical protein FPV67DRAFT_1485129 [Lyophyllum atratum]|nr:hypothetical protein FPV67DRAFT_1485129 [Lyophyllum atratum]